MVVIAHNPEGSWDKFEVLAITYKGGWVYLWRDEKQKDLIRVFGWGSVRLEVY